MSKRSLLLVAGCLGLALTGTAAWAQVDESEEIVLDEIVVTALKRGEQSVWEVPAAVAVFDGSDLERIGANSLVDFLQRSPGVGILETSITPGQVSIQIRGINSIVGDALVGYYVDEVPFGLIQTSLLPNAGTYDLERVEVLRGPQGTLYGAGAIAGVVRMITADPELDTFGGKADGVFSSTKDGDTNWSGKAALNMPLSEGKWGLRLVGSYEDWSGWVNGPPPGTIDPITGAPGAPGENVNNSEINNFRAKLLGQPTDRFTVRAMFWNSKTEYDDLSVADDNGILNVAVRQPGSVEYDLGNLTLEYDFENVSLLSSSSYFDYSSFNIKDFFGTQLFSWMDTKAFVQEIRLHSTQGGPFQWTAGGYYKDIDQDIVQDATQLIGPTGIVGQNDNNTSYALFADGTVHFAVDWEFSAGLRYFNETRETLDTSGLIPPDVNSNDFDAILPRFNLGWHPTENSTVYANAAKGFRSGLNQGSTATFFAQLLGVTIPPAAEDEDLWAYELGYKGLFQNGRLSFEAAAFFNDWTNLQVLIPVILGQLSAVVNAGSAESPGVEMAVDYSATDNLNIGFSAGWNDAKVTEDLIIDSSVPGMPGVTVPVVVFTDGDRINNVPEWTANGWLNYIWPVGSAYEGVFYLGAQYSSERINRAGGASVDTSDDLFKVDTRIGIRSDRWAAFLFCDNCTDENGAVFPAFGATLPESSRFRPQTIGLNLQVFY